LISIGVLGNNFLVFIQTLEGWVYTEPIHNTGPTHTPTAALQNTETRGIVNKSTVKPLKNKHRTKKKTA